MLIFFLLIFAIVPTAVFLTTALTAPDLLGYNQSQTFTFYGSVAGTFFSYYGLLITVFTLTEVRSLSRRYFFKMRSPDIRKDLDNISKEMSNLQSEPAQELKTMSFMSRLPSVVRLAKRLDNSDIKKISREVQKAYKSLKHESERADAVEKCGQVKDYWNVQQKVRELSEEIKIQNSDMMVK